MYLRSDHIWHQFCGRSRDILINISCLFICLHNLQILILNAFSLTPLFFLTTVMAKNGNLLTWDLFVCRVESLDQQQKWSIRQGYSRWHLCLTTAPCQRCSNPLSFSSSTNFTLSSVLPEKSSLLLFSNSFNSSINLTDINLTDILSFSSAGH